MLVDPLEQARVDAVVAAGETWVVRGRVPEDRDGASVLGNRLEGLDRDREPALGVQSAVPLLRERRVHHDERQLPRAGLAALGVPQPVRVRRSRAQARPRRPGDARVVAQARRAQLSRKATRVAAQVVVPQPSK